MSIMDVEQITVDRYPVESLVARLASAVVAHGLVTQETLEGYRAEGTVLTPAYYLGLGNIALVDNTPERPEAAAGF